MISGFLFRLCILLKEWQEFWKDIIRGILSDDTVQVPIVWDREPLIVLLWICFLTSLVALLCGLWIPAVVVLSAEVHYGKVQVLHLLPICFRIESLWGVEIGKVRFSVVIQSVKEPHAGAMGEVPEDIGVNIAVPFVKSIMR